MPALKQIIAPFLKRRLLSALAGILLVLVIALVTARLWIAGDGGRSWLLSQIDGRKAGAYGIIRAEGLSGDPLGRLYLRRLALQDSQGEWLIVQNVSLDWSPMALTSGLVDIKTLSAGQVRFLRRPVTEKQPASSKSSDIRIRFRNLSVPDLTFEEGFAGPEAHFTVTGRYDQQARALAMRLNASPRDAGSDRFLIDLHRDTSGAFSLDADINGAPGGIVTNLVGLETSTGITLKATASGTLQNASGQATLVIGDQSAATAEFKIHESRLTATADIDATHLPMLSRQLSTLIGDTASLRLESTTGRRSAPFGIEASLRAGEISVRGDVDTRTWRLSEPAMLDVNEIDIEPLLGEPSKVSFTGTAAQERDAWRLQGVAGLSVKPDSTLPFERAEGPVKLMLAKKDIEFVADLNVAKPMARTQVAADLIGATTTIHLAGRIDRSGQTITLDSSEATLATGQVSASGQIDLSGKRMDIGGTLSTALTPLPGDVRGDVTGPFSVIGSFDKPAIDLNLAIRDLSGLPEILTDATGPAPTVRAALTLQEGGIKIGSARLAGQRLVVTAAGIWSWSGNSDVRAALTQSEPLRVGDWSGQIGNAQVQLTGRPKARRIEITTLGGKASGSGRRIADLALNASLSESDAAVSGPVRLRALVDGEDLSADARFARRSGETRLDEISGSFGPGRFSGTAALMDKGDFTGDFTVDGTSLSWSGGRAREARGTIHLFREDGVPIELEASIAAKDLEVGPGRMLRFDRANAIIRSAPEGYNIHGNFASDDPDRATDLTFNASATLEGPAPAGMFELSGVAFGEPIATASPALWQLGDAPKLVADIAVLSGRIQAGFTGGGGETRLVLDATGIDLSPVLAFYDTGANRTYLEGHGDLRIFGAEPAGTIHLVAASDVPGLDSSLLVNLDGTLSPQAFSFEMQSDYGGRLVLRSAATIPVVARAGRMIAPDRAAPLSGHARLAGDLAVLRTATLAFGHDISGTIDASATLSGTINAPAYEAKAHVDNGTYELGSMGFQLSGITLDAAYDGKILNVDGKAGAPGGGAFALNGELGGEQTRLTADFRNLLLYNRDGDHLRGTGILVFADNRETRTLTGKAFVNQARFSLENLPSARPHALDVRWTDDPPTEPGTSRLRRTLALDIDLSAERRVYVTGRGLDSEWQMNLSLTGTPAAPLLNGTTKLVRGDLDLAGRPFVFDRGQIDFDGPINRARIAVSAERTVNGFDARVDVTGSPLKPVFELSSSPELPQDEILSRLLFGRSSMDLSPFEAAQLATSIARLSGASGGFDPAGNVQAALGIDRLSIGTSESGAAQIGVGQYLTDEVYLELKSAGAEGSSVKVEWQPRPQIAVTSETHATGESKVSIRWKKDY